MNNKQENRKILVIDDDPIVLEGTLPTVQSYLSSAEITAVTNIQAAKEILFSTSNKTSFHLILSDLQLPMIDGGSTSIENGKEFIREVMHKLPYTNLMILTSHIRDLKGLFHEIDNHKAGMTVAGKNIGIPELKKRIGFAIQGASHTLDLRKEGCGIVELKADWHDVLKLAFEKELTDKYIAKEMNWEVNNVNRIWKLIRGALGIYKENGRNLKVATFKAALRERLIHLD